MATATVARKARQAHKAQAKGEFVAQRSEGGAWVDVISEKYENDHHRANLLGAYSEWVNNAPAGVVRRAVEHCTIDGKPRHIIRAESMPRVQIEPWNEVDCALEARQRRRAVELVATPAPLSGWQGEYTRDGATYTPPSLQ